ncbi:uncharacterized protein LOC106664234 isoform X2 [Cimex lectularius]|uniref:Uncharacterized protein n=1 Tax=Cimex lectularius TaxID=79782 RepID=A0A8I6RH36_CIMLE|nr:uncharacterized protein LOC106664234 isoform X2 [Cimex lectularius]
MELEREINSGLESEATMRQAVINISVLKFLELVGSADPPLRKQLFVTNLLASAKVSMESILPSNDNRTIRYPLVSLATEAGGDFSRRRISGVKGVIGDVRSANFTPKDCASPTDQKKRSLYTMTDNPTRQQTTKK